MSTQPGQDPPHSASQNRPAAPQRPPSRRRGAWRRRLVWATLGFVGLTVAAWGWAAFQARRALNHEIAALRAARKPVAFSDLALSPSESVDNAWPLLDQAALPSGWDPQALRDRIDAYSREYHGRAGSLVPRIEPEPLFEALLAQHADSLALIRQAVTRPQVRCPLDFQTDDPLGVLLPQVQEIRDGARLLRIELLDSLARGDTPRAVDSLETAFALAEVLRDEPLLVSQLVRVSMLSMALQSLEDLLAHERLEETDRAQLDRLLAAREAGFRMAVAIQGERAMCYSAIVRFKAGSTAAAMLQPSGGDTALMNLVYGVARPMVAPLVDDELTRLVRLFNGFEAAIDQPGRAGYEQMAECQRLVGQAPRRALLTRLLMPSLTAGRNAAMRVRQRLIHARWALRVDRYYREHGRLPERLEQVADAELPQVAPGLLAGETVVLRATREGFAIYTVGANGIDNYGDARADADEANVLVVSYADRRPANGDTPSQE